MLSLIAQALFAALAAFFIVRLLLFVVLSKLHQRANAREHALPLCETPTVSIIVPCYNEEPTVDNCVASLLAQRYPAYEIILVNDGSTDRTDTRCRLLALKHPELIRYYRKENGGKASALNYGIERARGDIVVTIDADSIFLEDTLGELTRPFTDPSVGAVCGNVKVANRSGFIGSNQSAEYIVGLNLYRRAFAHLSCVQVISGAVGAFRRDALAAIGGYSGDTLVEDMDVTIALARYGYRVAYNSYAIAYTEAPERVRDLVRQRRRWILGGFQVLSKYRGMLFRPRYGAMGMFGLPFFLLMPWLGACTFALGLYGMFELALSGEFSLLFILYASWAGTQALLLAYTLYLDQEDVRHLPTACADFLWYQPLLHVVTIWAGLCFVCKSKVGWGALPRLGKNTLAAAA